jgi:tetratricopeptide (TPR) repeat protein
MLQRRESVEADEAARLELVLEIAEIFRTRLGQPDAAIPALERAAQAAPEDPRVLGPLADLYFAAGRHLEAQPIYEALADEARSKRRMKDVAKYRQRIGGIAEASGQMDVALAAYEEAFRVNPTDVATMAGLGRIYLADQNWEKARRVYRSMVLQNIDPGLGITKAEVYYALGNIHVQLGENAKAKGMYQRGLELEPDNQALKQALAAVQ